MISYGYTKMEVHPEKMYKNDYIHDLVSLHKLKVFDMLVKREKRKRSDSVL